MSKSQEKKEVMTVLYEQTVFDRPFKVYGTPQEPLFLAKDVARMLGHSQVSRMIESIDEDEKEVNIVHTPGGPQEMWFLTERGLYEVLFRSRKPIAKEFKAKVKDILYSIRTTGQYGVAGGTDEYESVTAVLKLLTAGLQGLSETQRQVVTRLEQLEKRRTAKPTLSFPLFPKPDLLERDETINRWMLSSKVCELSELTGRTGNSILHQLYIMLEKEFGISMNEITGEYRRTSGDRTASTFCAVASQKELYFASLDALSMAIKENSVFK